MRTAWTKIASSALAAIVGVLLVTAVAAATAIGWMPRHLAEHGLTSLPCLTAGFAVVGTILTWQRPRNPVGWLMVATGVVAALVTAAVPLVVYAAQRGWPLGIQSLLASVSYAGWAPWLALIPLTLLFFPEGRLGGPLARAVAAVVILAGTWVLVLSLADPTIFRWLGELGIPSQSPLAASGVLPTLQGAALQAAVGGMPLAFAAAAAGGIGVVVVLAVRFAGGDDRVRRQLFWVLLAGLTMIVLTATGAFAALLGPAFGLLSLVVLPVFLLIAMLRVNLFDIRLVFSRALAWTILTIVLTAAYVALVALLVRLLEDTTSAVVAALVVALAFDPLRRALQRLADRVVYGRRGEATYLVGLVGAHVSRGNDLDALIAQVAQALRLPWIAVSTDDGRVAASGIRPASVLLMPLRHDDALVGTLEVAARSGESALSRTDRRVLELLAPLFAVLLRLTLLSEGLRRSRGEIVQAREEERRRVQRDLHDGVASALAGIAFKIEGVLNLPSDDTPALLSGIHDDVVRTGASLREVIDGLRPPELDALGLVGALRSATRTIPAGRTSGSIVAVRAASDRPELPAATELALYRVGIEAVTNALRHSDGTEVTIELDVDDHEVRLTVRDNGLTTGAWMPGIGLRSMSERIELLAGRFRAGPSPDGGLVEAVLPRGSVRDE